MKLIKTFSILCSLFIIGGCINFWGKKNQALPSPDKPVTSSLPDLHDSYGQEEKTIGGTGGQQSATTNKDYIIGPEDVLKIQVWDNLDLDREVQVSREGIFSFPLIGSVKADGLSVTQLEREIRERLADGYIVNPNVTITIKEYKSKKVFVIGQVIKPGSYPLTGTTDLLDIISQAGGPSDEAEKEAVIVRPKNNLQVENPTLPQEAKKSEIITINIKKLLKGEVSLNMNLQNGDTIYIPKINYYYVFGEVNKPGRYPLEEETTVLKGIAIAGGLTEKGSKWRTKLLRVRDGQKIEIKAKMDQFVEPEDIISVPESFF